MIDHTKYSVEQLVSALHKKLLDVTPDDLTEYNIKITSQGVDKWCVTQGVEYVRKNNVQAFNLRGEWVGK